MIPQPPRPNLCCSSCQERKTSANAPRTLTKEELADYIKRDEFWQQCEAASGEGDGYQYGRGAGRSKADDEDDTEPIYDDCNEIRRKINAFLKTSRMTQTLWLKLIDCNADSYGRFMKLKGKFNGNHNGVYAGAARFFESLSILEHKPKSAKRLEEEAAFGRYGRSTAVVPKGGWVFGNDTLQADEFGRIRVVKGDTLESDGRLPRLPNHRK